MTAIKLGFIQLQSLRSQLETARTLGREEEFLKSLDLDIEKGGKAAIIGEIREFGGKKYIKTNNGWKFHGKGTGEKAQLRMGTFKEQSAWNSDKPSKLDLSKHSKQELLDAMRVRVKSGMSESDPEMKQLQAELDKRIKESKLSDKEVGVEPKKKMAEDDQIVSDYFREFGAKKEVNQPKPTIHIGDMSEAEMHAQAAKMNIPGHESMSKKELAKKLVDANIDKQLAEFRARKEAENINLSEIKGIDRLSFNDKYRTDKYMKDHFPNFTSEDHRQASKKHLDFESTEEGKKLSFNDSQNNRTIAHYHQEMAKKKESNK